MVDLALSIACSLTIGMIFKHAGLRRLPRLPLLTLNYAAAFALAAVLLSAEHDAGVARFEVGLVVLGSFTGGFFILGFFIFALATEVAGMSLAVVVMRLSVVIPFLASWVIWNEVPTPAQGVGLVLAGIAFFLIASRNGRAGSGAPPPDEAGREARNPVRVALVLVSLFAVGGVVDVFMKTFDEGFAAGTSQRAFMLLVFGVAFLVGAALVGWHVIQTGQWPGGSVLLWGVLLGVANYGSVEFFLRAIRQLSGPFVFPANNIAIVLGAALLGVLVWSERLSGLNWAGIGLAAAALVLLNL